MNKYVIIGMGAAGATCAESLRKLEPKAEITIINGEEQPFYLRLDLATILEGAVPAKLIARPDEYWEEQNIKVVNSRAVKLDHASQVVFTASGDRYGYNKLLIAVGAQARRLSCPGSELIGICTYRTLQDAMQIYELREQVKKVVIVGGGILGMEIAQAGWSFGWEMTLLVRESHVGVPLLDEAGGEFVHQAIVEGRVNIIYEDEVERYEGEDKVEAVVTKKGETLPIDLVVECIGVEPKPVCAEELELVEKGRIRVDEQLRTAIPTIFAAGDVAVVKTTEGNDVFCNNWNVAVSQGKVAAEAMTGADSKWSEGVYYNADSFYDQEFAIIGAWDRRHRDGRKIEAQTTEEAFRAVVTVDGVIESALVMGDKTGMRLLRQLIASKANVKGKFKKLFDPEATAEEF